MKLSDFRNKAAAAMKKVAGKKEEERKPQKAMDAGARAKRKLARRVHKSTVSDFVPDDIQDSYQKEELAPHISKGVEAAKPLVKNGIEQAMAARNGEKPKPKEKPDSKSVFKQLTNKDEID